MRKYLIGTIIGIVLSTSTSVFADSLIGQTVSNIIPLYIDGKRADKDLIVVNGTSYAPMRAASNLFGYTIQYVPDKKEVQMKRNILQSRQWIKIKSMVNNYNQDSHDGEYILNNNEVYVPASSIGTDYFKYDSSTKTITGKINSFEVKGDLNSKIENSDPIVIIDGAPYVKISALGLKGTFTNGELIIDK